MLEFAALTHQFAVLTLQFAMLTLQFAVLTLRSAARDASAARCGSLALTFEHELPEPERAAVAVAVE